jgi:hypothetical protein
MSKRKKQFDVVRGIIKSNWEPSEKIWALQEVAHSRGAPKSAVRKAKKFLKKIIK